MTLVVGHESESQHLAPVQTERGIQALSAHPLGPEEAADPFEFRDLPSSGIKLASPLIAPKAETSESIP